MAGIDLESSCATLDSPGQASAGNKCYNGPSVCTDSRRISETILARKQTRTRRSAGDARESAPRYQQVADTLRAQIIAAGSADPVRLPTERELGRIHKVSWPIISKALDVLAGEGLIERARKRGTFTVPAGIRQGKRRRQGHTIHLVASGDPYARSQPDFYSQVYRGIFGRCEQAGCDLSVQEYDESRATLSMNLSLPKAQQDVAGVLIVGVMSEEVVRLYADQGYPVVSVDYWTKDPRADAVVLDCFSEGQMAAEFLLRHGHTRLFYIGHLLKRSDGYEEEPDSDLFLAGMQRALRHAGLPTLSELMIGRWSDEQEAFNQMLDWLLSRRPTPTAGVVFSLGQCIRLLRDLPEHGIRCPEDLSLISKTCEGHPTEITSTRCSGQAIGEAAVDVLLDRASGRRSTPVRLVLPSTLLRGRTVRQLSDR